MKNLTRLLEVRLHVPADVKVVGECHGAAKSPTYCDGIAYVSCPTGIQQFSITKKPTLQLKNLKKVEKEKLRFQEEASFGKIQRIAHHL